MAKDFTNHNHSHDSLMLTEGYSQKKIRTSPKNASPSESVVRNLLNYSKALVVVSNLISGEYSCLLLN